MAPRLVPLTGVEAAKRQAAYYAVDKHLPNTARHVGIGSGSTVVYVVQRISQLPKETTEKMTFYSTGFQSKGLIQDAGLRLGDISDVGEEGLDVAFDGADEVDPRLNCIKGGGACLVLEKIVAVCASVFVVVADFRKLSKSLLTQYAAIPVEVLPSALKYTQSRIQSMGGQSVLRSGLPGKAGPVVTDNGNFILDVVFPSGLVLDGIRYKEEGVEGLGKHTELLAEKLKGIVGVVDHGLFWEGDKKPVVAYFGMEDGSVVRRKANEGDIVLAKEE